MKTKYSSANYVWPLLCLMVFIIGLWSTYWAFFLQKDGCVLTERALACTPNKGTNAGLDLFSVQILYQTNRGEEWVYKYTSVDPVPVGASYSFYIQTGPRLLRRSDEDERIPAGWYYPWRMPAIAFLVAGILAFGYLIYSKHSRLRYLTTIISGLVLLAAIVISIAPFSETMVIRRFVIAQRLNDKYGVPVPPKVNPTSQPIHGARP